jgi:hypothetical protein
MCTFRFLGHPHCFLNRLPTASRLIKALNLWLDNFPKASHSTVPLCNFLLHSRSQPGDANFKILRTCSRDNKKHQQQPCRKCWKTSRTCYQSCWRCHRDSPPTMQGCNRAGYTVPAEQNGIHDSEGH